MNASAPSAADGTNPSGADAGPGTPHSATATEVEAVAARIVASMETIVRCSARWHEPGFLALDVTMAQAKVLRLLALHGPMAMSALAAQLGLSMPTLSGIADRLVEHGLVERRTDPDDRRMVLLSVTPSGSERVERFREVGRQQLRMLLDGLSSDDLLALDRGMAALADCAERQGTRVDAPARDQGASADEPTSPARPPRPTERTSP